MIADIAISPQECIKHLHNSDIGEGLPESVLARLAGISSILQLELGEVLTMEGASGHHMYVIIQGSIEVQLAPNDENSVSASRMLPAGSVIGEMSIIEASTRTARTIATEPTSLLCIRDQDLWGLFDADPLAGYQFMRNLARVLSHRLRQTNLAIRNNFFT